MKILVLSDTHIPIAAKELPPQVLKELESCQLCIHAGDFVEYKFYKKLSSYNDFIGVAGNMDDEQIKQHLPEKKVINIEGVNIAAIHGYGPPQGLIKIIEKEFSDVFEKIHIFIFGHSHQPFHKEIKGKIYFNPGSPTEKFFSPYNSYGVIEIEGKENIKCKIVRVE